MDWYFTHGKNAESACRHFSISKSVFYRWFNRFNKYNLSSLEFDTGTRRPHRTRQMSTPQEIISLVCSIREQDPEKSKYEIQAELKEKYDIKLGYNTIQKIINRSPRLRNLAHKRRIKKYRNYKIARVKAAYELKDKGLGSLVQVDTKYFHVLGRKFYILAAVDCKSRYTYNGPEYLLYFHKLTEKLGIPHYFSHPQTPKMNSRVERLIQTLEYEFLHYQELLPEIECLRRLCERFNAKYNQRRYHQALHYQTPAIYVTRYLQEGGQPFSI